MENSDYVKLMMEHMFRNNINQSELSTLLEVTKGNLSHWISGTNGISAKNRRKIEQVCARTIAELKQESDSESINIPQNIGTIKNTSELRECIKDAMMNARITDYITLSKSMGYDSPRTVKRLLDGSIDFFPSMLSAMFAALNINPDQAPLSASDRMMLDPTPYQHGAMLTRPIPIYDLAAAAGGFEMRSGCIQPIERHWEGKVFETTPVPIDGRDLAAFRVTGNSMYPKLEDGDIVFCDKCRRPENGRIAVVCFSNDYKPAPGLCVIKVWRKFGDHIILSSINTDPSCNSYNYDAESGDIEWSALAVEKKGVL